MKKTIVVVDMQKDFISGALGTKEEEAIVKNVIDKVEENQDASFYYTMDTHQADYMETQEGKNLPVPHCIEETDGWKLEERIAKQLSVLEKQTSVTVVKKLTFGSTELVELIKKEYIEDRSKKEEELQIVELEKELDIELFGLCTDICVISNAMLLKAALPEAKISVDATCSAGVTPESHTGALNAMKMCQINIKGE